MRFVGNAQLGRIRPARMPLEICPGRRVWERHRNREYLVFVDESFYRFFGFDAVDGNFCHAALGVPRDSYARLQELLRPLVQEYGRRMRVINGRDPDEIKFTALRNLLPPRFRLRFTRELVRSLTETGGFVAGFYSSTRGVIMERVRTDLLDGHETVPNDHLGLYNAARGELLMQFRGAGQSRLITQLLLSPFAAFSALLGSFDCRFRVEYDPRQSDEDEAVRDALADYMQHLANMPDLFGDGAGYLGMEIGIRSHDELGLQLADVFAGEVREFFRSNREPLEESATLRLITPESNEPLQKFMMMNGLLFKTGALSRMSPALARKLVRRNSANLISYYYPVLCAGMLTCVTNTGQFRDLEIPTRMISDLLD